MNLKLIFIYLGLLSTELLIAQNQITELSLKQVVEMARMESPDAQTARHSFRSAYWNYKYYRANYLPSLSLTSDPNLNRAINKITMGDGSVKFVEQNLLNTDLTLNLSQNLSWTGGSFFLETSAQRMDLFSEHKYSWQTSPIMIGYRQSLFGYNSLKWDRRIEPVRYQEAKKSYVETLELVSANAIHKFFALATAQSDYDIASFNYANADTLYRYAQGRYNIGTITENEMLQLELNRLTEETNRMNARIEMDNCMQELRSYLGIHEDRDLRVLVSPQVPDFSVNLNEALVLAYENSPDIQTMERRKLESESAVAKARANAGLKADIYLRFGLTQTADKLPEAYRNLLDQQYVSIGISLPILDWGRGKGQVRVARSNRDLVYTHDKWFTEDQLIVSAGVGVVKPDVQIFRMAEEKWGMKPENTFMIGDSLENDIAGAKNAGWKTIWMNHHRYTVPEGMEKPDYIAYTEEELRKLIVQICFTTKKDG